VERAVNRAHPVADELAASSYLEHLPRRDVLLSQLHERDTPLTGLCEVVVEVVAGRSEETSSHVVEGVVDSHRRRGARGSSAVDLAVGCGLSRCDCGIERCQTGGSVVAEVMKGGGGEWGTIWDHFDFISISFEKITRNELHFLRSTVLHLRRHASSHSLGVCLPVLYVLLPCSPSPALRSSPASAMMIPYQ
jgi:hypothetical protein